MTRDTEVFSKMDPYAKIEYREQRFKSKVKQGAGKTPKWNEIFDIDVKYVGDDIKLQILDEDVTSSDLVSILRPLIFAGG